MFIRRRKPVIIIVMVIMVLGIFNNVLVSANDEIPNTSIFIDSRFKLWDLNEKMIDGNFNITVYYFNETTNNTAYYKIDIDDNISEGFFKTSIKKQFSINSSMIHSLKVYINNETIYHVTNIIITNQISKSLIDYANNEWTINLSPFDWGQKERNIFFAVVISALISLFIAYRITTKYKKSRGITTIK